MASPDQTDDVLAAALRAGSEPAWRRAYDAAFPALYRYVLMQTRGDVAQTEEIVQDVWLTAVRRINRYDPTRGTFDAWLHGIAERHCVNTRRRRARRQRLLDAQPGSPTRSWGNRVALESADAVAAVWERLPATYRRILRGKYLDGRSTNELAAREGRSPKAVEGLLTRARKAFRRAYESISQAELDNSDHDDHE